MINKNKEREIPFLNWLIKRFKKPIHITKDCMGIYQFIWSSNTFHDESTGLNYDVFVKVKAVKVFDSLVEVEVMDIKINNSPSQDVINLITHNFPRYINPKHIKWEIK